MGLGSSGQHLGAEPQLAVSSGGKQVYQCRLVQSVSSFSAKVNQLPRASVLLQAGEYSLARVRKPSAFWGPRASEGRYGDCAKMRSQPWSGPALLALSSSPRLLVGAPPWQTTPRSLGQGAEEYFPSLREQPAPCCPSKPHSQWRPQPPLLEKSIRLCTGHRSFYLPP